jgi:hypothetical protein
VGQCGEMGVGTGGRGDDRAAPASAAPASAPAYSYQYQYIIHTSHYCHLVSVLYASTQRLRCISSKKLFN